MSLSWTISEITTYFLKPKEVTLTLNTSLSEVIYHLCTSTPLYQSHTTFDVPSVADSKDMIGEKFKKTVHVTLTTPIRDSLSS